MRKLRFSRSRITGSLETFSRFCPNLKRRSTAGNSLQRIQSFTMAQVTTPMFRGNPFINRSEVREHAPIRTVGIIGAGQMGNGIAHVVSLAGYTVLLNDISRERVESALATINGNMSRQVHRGKITSEDRDKALSLISYASSLDALSNADVVVEAATEDEDIKR